MAKSSPSPLPYYAMTESYSNLRLYLSRVTAIYTFCVTLGFAIRFFISFSHKVCLHAIDHKGAETVIVFALSLIILFKLMIHPYKVVEKNTTLHLIGRALFSTCILLAATLYFKAPCYIFWPLYLIGSVALPTFYMK